MFLLKPKKNRIVKGKFQHKCLYDVVVEDLLWNSLDDTVLKQRGKDRSLEDLLPQKGQIGGIRVQLST